MKSKSYEEFVEKFKPKKTTDDCYTPPIVYDAIRQYVNDKVFNLVGYNVVRPFYPGGDYEHYGYKWNDIVIDNPPFSILAKIVDFYTERGIKYWLFAPHLTLFNYANRPCTLVVTDSGIIYENGANVNTDFITNLYDDETLVVCNGELHDVIRRANEVSQNKQKKKMPVYVYPPHVVTSAILGGIANKGVSFVIKRKGAAIVKTLDAQREHKKAIFGCGLLLSDTQVKAAERAAERKFVWKLSEREYDIIEELNRQEKSCL